MRGVLVAYLLTTTEHETSELHPFSPQNFATPHRSRQPSDISLKGKFISLLIRITTNAEC